MKLVEAGRKLHDLSKISRFKAAKGPALGMDEEVINHCKEVVEAIETVLDYIVENEATHKQTTSLEA